MTVIHELVRARGDLESLLTDVLRSVFGQEPDVLPAGSDAAALAERPWADAAGPGVPARDRGPDAAGDAPPAYALLAVSDDADGSLLGVQVGVAGRLAQVLAARMFSRDEPTSEELLDAVGELANIIGGNVKGLLVNGSGPARLSLPSAALGRAAGLPPPRHLAAPRARDAAAPAPTTIRALVLGHLAELTLTPHVEGHGLVWPPALRADVLEGHS